MLGFAGYVIEKLELPNSKWLKCNFGNVSETNYNVEGLNEGTKYEFRVFAKNAAGATSLPAKTIQPVFIITKNVMISINIKYPCHYIARSW